MPDAATQTLTTTEIPSAVQITVTGLVWTGEISDGEWRNFGRRIGEMVRTSQWVIGDWLVYGEDRLQDGLVSMERYKLAHRLTGIDVTTLQSYASISRNVPCLLRNKELSFEHHKRVAPLKSDEEKTKWLQITAAARESGDPVSARRLAKSILAGRLISREELSRPPEDRGIKNIHPHINGAVRFVAGLRASGWFDAATPEKLENLLADLRPILEIAVELRRRLSEN